MIVLGNSCENRFQFEAPNWLYVVSVVIFKLPARAGSELEVHKAQSQVDLQVQWYVGALVLLGFYFGPGHPGHLNLLVHGLNLVLGDLVNLLIKDFLGN